MSAWFFDPALWSGFLTLTALEVVLGVDNLIFISITAERLPPHQRAAARKIGLALALVLRLVLLTMAVWLTGLTTPVVSILGVALSWKDMILLGGGGFLLVKATLEIHHAMTPEAVASSRSAAPAAFAAVLIQILLLDAVFSVDSIITAVAMTRKLGVMAAAVVVAILMMMFAAGPVSGFIVRNPSIKMLALSFLLLIGTVLVADGFGAHIPRGYIYFAIAFSLLVEALNLIARRHTSGNRHDATAAAKAPVIDHES